MDVSKNRGKTTKMDGLFHGKSYEQMDDLGGFSIFLVQHPSAMIPERATPKGLC